MLTVDALGLVRVGPQTAALDRWGLDISGKENKVAAAS